MKRGATFAAVCLLLAGCKPKVPSGPVCGLHSAAAPVWRLPRDGSPKLVLAVGSQLFGSDQLEPTGPALIECFGGAVKKIDKGDEVRLARMVEASVQGATYPEKALRLTRLVEVAHRDVPVAARYTSVMFTPESALTNEKKPTDRDYFLAFFTPHGIEKLQGGPPGEGPRKLPAPPNRAKVPHIHAGDLGTGGMRVRMGHGVAFAETDDLATGALLEDAGEVDLGQSVRLLVPEGSRVELLVGERPVDLLGPADLRLK